MQAAVKLKTKAPDLSKLAAWPSAEWRAFGRHLEHIGLQRKNLKAIDEVAPNQLPRLSLPLLRWHLSKVDRPFAHAARLLMMHTRITRLEAIAALGESLLEKLLAVGLVVEGGDGLFSSPFRLTLPRDRYIFADDLRLGADAVMGSGGTTTALIDAAYPKRRLQRALDLGCGAGAMALVLAPRTEKVIAVDINPRALIFGRINAAINGIKNVEFREGDLFTPVEGDQFDLIVSQPPFIPMPKGSAPTTFLFGGSRGDELPMRLLSETAAHLKDGGRAIVFIQWPEIKGDPLPERVRSVVKDSDTDVLLIVFPPTQLDYFATVYCSYDQPELGEQYENQVARWRDHFEEQKMLAMRNCFNVPRKRKGKRGWTRAVYPQIVTVTPGGLHNVLRRCDLLSESNQAILSSTLRIPEGASISHKTSLDETTNGQIRMDFDDHTITRPAAINRAMFDLLRTVNRSTTVAHGIRAYAAEQGQDRETALDTFLPCVRSALELGMLEVSKSARHRRKK